MSCECYRKDEWCEECCQGHKFLSSNTCALCGYEPPAKVGDLEVVAEPRYIPLCADCRSSSQREECTVDHCPRPCVRCKEMFVGGCVVEQAQKPLDVETPCLSPIAITDADQHKRASDAADIVLHDIYGGSAAHDDPKEIEALERAERESWLAVCDLVRARMSAAGVRIKSARVTPGEGEDGGYLVELDTADGLTVKALIKYADLMRRVQRTSRSHVEETARIVTTRALKAFERYRVQQMIDRAVRS